MKLLRYGPPGEEKPGLLDENGRIRDLSDKLNDLDGAALDPDRLSALAKMDTESLPLVEGNPRLGPPVSGVGKIRRHQLRASRCGNENRSARRTDPVQQGGDVAQRSQ